MVCKGCPLGRKGIPLHNVLLAVADESRTEHQENDLHESCSSRLTRSWAQNASSETRDGLTPPGLQLIAPAFSRGKCSSKTARWVVAPWLSRALQRIRSLSSRHFRGSVAHGVQVNSVALGNGKVFMRHAPDIFGVLALRDPPVCSTRAAKEPPGYEWATQQLCFCWDSGAGRQVDRQTLSLSLSVLSLNPASSTTPCENQEDHS